MEAAVPSTTPIYGFYGRLSPVFPSQVLVDVTEVCNLACIHCPHPQFKQSEYYGGRFLEPELNAKLAEEVRQHGQGATQYVRYTSMGEPLIHPQIYDMLGYMVRHSGVLVSLTTNGVPLTEKNIERLLNTGIDMVDISIDAFAPETYAKIRVHGNLEVTRNNVLNLLRMRSQVARPPKVVVSFIEQPQNSHEIAPFKQYWEAQGADHVIIRRLHSAAGSVTDFARILWQENAGAPRRPCVYPWERLVLDPQGRLDFCPVDWVHGASFVDYRTTTIYETWQSEFYQRLRQAHLTNDFTRHPFCGQCPDWKTVRWPDEAGRSYADVVQSLKDQAGGPVATGGRG